MPIASKFPVGLISRAEKRVSESAQNVDPARNRLLNVPRFFERILNTELDEHLDDERKGAGPANRRNGQSKKTMLTGTSKMQLSIPRGRAGTFDPMLIVKYQRPFPDFEDKIISMYARGMTVREIRKHLKELYGIDVLPI